MDIHDLQPYHPQTVYNHQIHIYLLNEWMLLELLSPGVRPGSVKSGPLEARNKVLFRFW